MHGFEIAIPSFKGRSAVKGSMAMDNFRNALSLHAAAYFQLRIEAYSRQRQYMILTEMPCVELITVFHDKATLS